MGLLGWVGPLGRWSWAHTDGAAVVGTQTLLLQQHSRIVVVSGGNCRGLWCGRYQDLFMMKSLSKVGLEQAYLTK